MRERHVHSDLPLAENPFHYNKRIEFPSRRTAKELYDRLLFSDSTTTKKLWFVHTIPTLLKISGSELIECFQEFGLFTSKTYKCIRRTLDENERGWYGIEERRRWRKILPKEWVTMVLGGGHYIKNPKMRQMFAGGLHDYALDTCQLVYMICIPILLLHKMV
uniref:Uncharacterized protein n=1 Tax=Triticum urartu TaxID=4572 RepID=A0A8R7URB5_TRIUA